MPELKLSKPLCVLDLETTGLSITTDRIVEFGVLKLFPDGREVTWSSRFNPGIPIPAEATAKHGITDVDVADKPFFASLAGKIHAGLVGCDIAGFNVIAFDVPMLFEHFYNSGVIWDTTNIRMVDAGIIMKKREERTLSAAVKFYCDRTHSDAHGAISDATATRDVVLGQMERYADLGCDVEALSLASKYDDKAERVDLSGKLLRKDGVIIFGFGKHEGRPVLEHQDYLDWMLEKDFPAHTKLMIGKILDELQVTANG